MKYITDLISFVKEMFANIFYFGIGVALQTQKRILQRYKKNAE